MFPVALVFLYRIEQSAFINLLKQIISLELVGFFPHIGNA